MCGTRISTVCSSTNSSTTCAVGYSTRCVVAMDNSSLFRSRVLLLLLLLLLLRSVSLTVFCMFLHCFSNVHVLSTFPSSFSENVVPICHVFPMFCRCHAPASATKSNLQPRADIPGSSHIRRTSTPTNTSREKNDQQVDKETMKLEEQGDDMLVEDGVVFQVFGHSTHFYHVRWCLPVQGICVKRNLKLWIEPINHLFCQGHLLCSSQLRCPLDQRLSAHRIQVHR